MERLKISTSVGLFRVPTDDIAYIEASERFIRLPLARRMNLFSPLAHGNADECPLLRPLTLRCPPPKPHNLRTRREKADYF